MSHGNTITYRCPKSGTLVEHRIDPAQRRQTYEAVVCNACGELHFVHRDTGKLLGHDRD